MATSSPLSFELDTIRIRVKSTDKSTTDAERTLRYHSKSVYAGPNWHIPIKELEPIEIQTSLNGVVVKFSDRKKDRQWTGTLSLKLTASRGQQEQQRRRNDLEKFVGKIQKAIVKQKSGSREESRTQSHSPRYVRDENVSTFTGRRFVRHTHVSPTPQRRSTVAKASRAKAQKHFEHLEFSSDDDEADNKDTRQGVGAQGHRGTRSPNGHGVIHKEESFEAELDDEEEEADELDDEEEEMDEIFLPRKAGGVDTGDADLRQSRNFGKERKRLVLHDDDDDDDGGDSTKDVSTSVNNKDTAMEVITEDERVESADSEDMGSDHEKSKKETSVDISKFFQPKPKKAASVILEGSATSSTATDHVSSADVAETKILKRQQYDETNPHTSTTWSTLVSSSSATVHAKPVSRLAGRKQYGTPSFFGLPPNTPMKRKSPVSAVKQFRISTPVQNSSNVPSPAEDPPDLDKPKENMGPNEESKGTLDDIEDDNDEEGGQTTKMSPARKMKRILRHGLNWHRRYQPLENEDVEERPQQNPSQHPPSSLEGLAAGGMAMTKKRVSSLAPSNCSSDIANVAPNRMVGLRNMGNTCYLNAALQMLFSLQGGFVADFLSFYEKCMAAQLSLQGQVVKQEPRAGAKLLTPPSNPSEPKIADTDQSTAESRSVASSFTTSIPLHRAVASVFYALMRSSPPPFIDHLDCTTKSGGNVDTASAFCVKRAVDLLTKSYHGNEQRDSHEFLLELLDLLDEEETKARDIQVSELKENIARVITPTKGDNNRSTLISSPASHLEYGLVSGRGNADDAGIQVGQYAGQKTSASPIEAHFKCEVEVKLVCDVCGYCRTRIEFYRHLSLDLTSRSDDEIQWTVKQGLDNFFQSQTVSIKCEKNRCEGQTCTQSQRIVFLPGALLLHLKRFKVHEQVNINEANTPVDVTYIKNRVRVLCPTSLSVEAYCKPVKGEGNGDKHSSCSKYRLRSVVHHIGDSASRGHYTTDALTCIASASRTYVSRSPLQPVTLDSTGTPGKAGLQTSRSKRLDASEEKWVRFDDAMTKYITAEDALSDESSQRNAYLLLFEIDRT